jgi:hypothetical protein
VNKYFMTAWIVGFLAVASACVGTTASSTPGLSPSPQVWTSTPEVISTRLTALLIGQLVHVENCLRVQSPYGTTSYLLVWPPDFDFQLEGDMLHVTDKLYGDSKAWRLGDTLEVGGGEISSPDSELRQRLPAHCMGPYWLFGGWLRPTATPRSMEFAWRQV